MARASISIAKGKGSMAHNNREFITENVDKDRIKDNITYKQESLTDAYEHCFGQAIQDYNDKQKRNDRKIDGVQGYINKIKNSKNGEKLFYENVVQVGNMFDSAIGSEQGEICKQILNDYMKSFQERNPNLYVFNAVLHLDEQTPHLHIDYIPIATDYQKGLSVRNSLDKALKQQGVDGKSNKFENRTIAWQKGEKDHIEILMNARGLQRAEDKGLDQEHLTVNQYKAVVNEIKNEVKELPKQIEFKPTLFDKEKVTVNKKDLEQLEHRARLSLTHEKASKNLIAEIKEDKKETQEIIESKLNWAEKYNSMALHDSVKAREEFEKYRRLYRQQQKLNESYNELLNGYKAQNEKLIELTAENKNLKAQINDLRQSIEQRVQSAIKSLQEQIQALQSVKKSLEERLHGMCESLTNVVKAFNLLKYDKDSGYRVELTKKQSRLFDGLENYAKNWLREENKHDMAVDIEKHIGLSKGIEKEIKALEPKNRGRDLSL
jgi:hypothetical protein